jgi:hypothetical protein
MKIKKTAYLVAAFVVAIILFFSVEAEANERSNLISHCGIAVGGGTFHYSGGVTQQISCKTPGNWRLAWERLGGKGWDHVSAYRVSREVSWRNRGRGPTLSIGAQYFSDLLEEKDRPGKAIVSERLTFVLGLGYEWSLSAKTALRVHLLHSSTAGRSERNRGIDRAYLSFDWRL